MEVLEKKKKGKQQIKSLAHVVISAFRGRIFVGRMDVLFF